MTSIIHIARIVTDWVRYPAPEINESLYNRIRIRYYNAQ